MAGRTYKTEPVNRFIAQSAPEPKLNRDEVQKEKEKKTKHLVESSPKTKHVEKKETQADKKMLDLSTLSIDMEDVIFSLGYIPLDLFVKNVKDNLKKAKEKKVKIRNIDFSHCGYITDVILKTLIQELGQKKLLNILKISLEGCSVVTDVGVNWLIKGLTRNKNSIQVNINGCSQIKDGGLATLAGFPNIGNVEAIATSVSHFRHTENSKGCPLLLKTIDYSDKIKQDSLLVVIPLGTRHSLAEFLQSRTAVERGPLHYLTDVAVQDWSLNILELERKHVLLEHVLPRNPIHVIISFDVSCELQQLKQDVADAIAHVLCKEQVNPPHKTQTEPANENSPFFIQECTWSQCHFSLDGTLRNISGRADVPGAVVSCQPISRSNSFFEVQCLSSHPETGLVMGIVHDVLYGERFPLNLKEFSSGIVEGFQTEVGACYMFGVKGPWLSEYVPSNNAVFFFSKNGKELMTKPVADNDQTGLYPIVFLVGEHSATVKLLNYIMPSHAAIEQWEERKQYWTPTCMQNVVCDGEGILSCMNSDQFNRTYGVVLCQEEITKNHNSLTIEVLEILSGTFTLGLGPEDSMTSQQLGNDHHLHQIMSVALLGNDGKITLINDQTPNEIVNNSTFHKESEIKIVVDIVGEGEDIQAGDTLNVGFFNGENKVGTVSHKIPDGTKSGRYVFKLFLSGSGIKVRMKNFLPPRHAKPSQLDLLTLDRANFMDVFDDGRLVYRSQLKTKPVALFLSMTPFNGQLTYFELRVTSLGQHHSVFVGFAHRGYPTQKQLGQCMGSVGYYGLDGELHYIGKKNSKNVTNSATCFGVGDTVGCGFDVQRGKVREDGSLESQQTLTFYFTVNGKKVHELQVQYQTDGLFPAVSLDGDGDEVTLVNFYPGQGCSRTISENQTMAARERETHIVEGCRLTLVALGNQTPDAEKKVQSLQHMIKRELEFPTLVQINSQIKIMENSTPALNFQQQQLLGNLYWHQECLQRFLANQDRLSVMYVDVSSGEGHKELADHIVEVCEKDLAMHREYYVCQDSLASVFNKIRTTLNTRKVLLASQVMVETGQDLDYNGKTLEAAFEYLHSKGYLLSLPHKITVLALDIQFAATLTDILQTSSKVLSERISPCIGERTRIWKTVFDMSSDLDRINQEQPELLNTVLWYLGVMRIPCLRLTKEDPKFCYCTSAGLGSLPVELSHFLDGPPSEVVRVQRKYTILTANTEHLFSTVVNSCLHVFRPLAISQTWSAFQAGAAQAVIFTEDGSLNLLTKCFMPSERGARINEDTKYHLEEYTFNIFCLFLDLIDDVLAKWGVQFFYSEQTPATLVNASIGCTHMWSLSSNTYRQTLCTLCGHCCEMGDLCPYDGLSGWYRHQCGCDTLSTGCQDCGICQSCADHFWKIRSSLRPNLEVARLGSMKSSEFYPLNATTYDEVEFTNLGTQPAAVCLQLFSSQYPATNVQNFSGPVTKLFPGLATWLPSVQSLQEHLTSSAKSDDTSKLMTFEQGDTVTVKLDTIKRDISFVGKVEETSKSSTIPVFFTSVCRNTKVWHEVGIVVYNGTSLTQTDGLFLSASPLTPEHPSFSFKILSGGPSCGVVIGVCHKRSLPTGSPGLSLGSLAYHANPGCIFTGSTYPQKTVEKCEPGDVMKCVLNFERQTASFYKNDTLVFESEPTGSFINLHAAVGLSSAGEAVCLLERDPWVASGDDKNIPPEAFDSYKYGNMQISPGQTLTLVKGQEDLTSWLLLNNPSKSPVGYKISSPFMPAVVGFLMPASCTALRLVITLEEAKDSQLTPGSNLEIHWFLLESGRDYSSIDMNQIYQKTTPESLFKHRLKVVVAEENVSDAHTLKMASEEPDINDHYLVHVFKNKVPVQKYWLKGGNYVCCLPLQCNVLVRYPKFPTLCQPNNFQKGMRILANITPNAETHQYAEAIIDDISTDGGLRLVYTQPGEPDICYLDMGVTSPEITHQNPGPNINKQLPVATNTQSAEIKSADTDIAEIKDLETENHQETTLNFISFQPGGYKAVTKRAYVFPPFHLLTESSQRVVNSFDIAWKVNSLNSVAKCHTLPTRLTVQELQISRLVGSNQSWLVGATSSRKFDLAFAFLPSQLGERDVCYPSIPHIFTDVSVHRLCFFVDQFYYNHHLAQKFNILLDAPLHFVNVAPITPSPPLSAEDMFASAFNGWTYTTLSSGQLNLPLCDNIFPGGKPDRDRRVLENLMRSLLFVFAAQCHIFAEQYGGIMHQSTSETGSQTVVASIEYRDPDIVKITDEAELSSNILIRKKFRNNVYCKAHQWCLPGNINIADFSFRPELFKPYEDSVNLIYRELPHMTKIQSEFYSFFPNLQYLELQSSGKLTQLPDGIAQCQRLEMLVIKNSPIQVLPADLFQLPRLQRLHCTDLKLKALPSSVIDLCPITELILSRQLLTSIPKELCKLTNLEYLDLNSNPLELLPMELKALTKLKTLLLCGIPWLVTSGSKVEMPLDQFEDFLKTNSSLKHYLGKDKLVNLFHECDHNKNSSLDENEIAVLNSHLFWKVPRLGISCISCTEFGGIPPVIFLLTGLETLHLDFQAITAITVHMCRLQNLKFLSISHNPLLESLSGSLGHLPSLKVLKLTSNPSLRTPPHEIITRGFTAVKAYLKRLAGGFTECRRTKLMLVGLGGAGKTSLLRALMSSDKRSSGTSGEDITNGIDILPWTVKTNDGLEITFNTWDFAGQTLYYNTHQFFLSKRAVYLLLWSTRQGFEHAGLEFWLSSITSHAPKTPIFIVGTHCDQVPKADIPMSELRERYPQIAGFHFVSSIVGTGIAELEKELLRVTLELKNMGEKVPKVWLNMEKRILAARGNTSILPWKMIREFATEVGIYDDKDIREAIQFLHELGTVQYFENEFLREHVVINPQWIVNVMSCLVSVKQSPIQENSGRFYHKHIPVVWKSYPSELHPWLLRLTEEFDLTFPLPDEDINIVPCLLPHEIPDQLDWPTADVNLRIKETKFTYHFTYLPAGLFNRAQVRLFQLSDGRMIWKRGSLLKKNKHRALISQTSDSELQVKVQGPRPQNVLFLIHEIFESLIKESFNGVIYELLVPCPDCVSKEGTLDPNMFEGSFVRRAKEHRAPFLQCRKYFHTISMTQLFEIMPPDSSSDIDAQLQNSLISVQQLSSALLTDVAIIYSVQDKVSDDDQSRVNPGQILKDLQSAGLSCWFSDSMDTVSVQDTTLALKNCKVVVALLSDNFERDEKCRDLLMYVMDTLLKDFIIVVIGDSLGWQDTDLGMRIGKQEEMVMIKNKSRYDSRVGDMIRAVRIKLSQHQLQVKQYPSVFISYCWSNSRDAQARGTKCPPEALGWADPREVKLELEKRGLTCWLDVDQPAAGKGLFRNITEGIKNAQVLLAFVSNEYVNSENCMMELRFSVFNMNLPVVVAVVGSGKEWKQSEVGILIHRSKAVKVNLQREDPKSLDTLEGHIRQRLQIKQGSSLLKSIIKRPVQQTDMITEQPKTDTEHEQDKSLFQEEYELMQRKFMRHIISFVSMVDSVPTPRLIVLDMERHAPPPSQADSRDTSNLAEKLVVTTDTKSSSLRTKTTNRSLGAQTFIRSPVISRAGEEDEERWESEPFCLKLLCEDDKGWHVCDKAFPVKLSDGFKNLIRGCSAYLARMYAILRQSAVTLNCFDGPLGLKYTSWIEENASDRVNFMDSYTSLRMKLVEDDKAQEFLSQLHRCHLPTGKVSWLCSQHASGPRITRLSREVTTRSESGQVLLEEDVKLKEKLQHSDVYKQRKKAKSPHAGIMLPLIADMPSSEFVAMDGAETDYTPYLPHETNQTGSGPSTVKKEDTGSAGQQSKKKEGVSKYCCIQ